MNNVTDNIKKSSHGKSDALFRLGAVVGVG